VRAAAGWPTPVEEGIRRAMTVDRPDPVERAASPARGAPETVGRVWAAGWTATAPVADATCLRAIASIASRMLIAPAPSGLRAVPPARSACNAYLRWIARTTMIPFAIRWGSVSTTTDQPTGQLPAPTPLARTPTAIERGYPPSFCAIPRSTIQFHATCGHSATGMPRVARMPKPCLPCR
jgi:hypothetical protein